jgi:hypothetical protein
MSAGGGFLRLPRVRVLWGKVNLSAYDGPQYGAPEVFQLPEERFAPIVYDVQVNLNAENEAPTAEMKWDPTGPGFAAYEYFIQKKTAEPITIEYFYPQGKTVSFIFVWAGQTINYGNDMTVTVRMVSELAGLVNGNIRNTAQAYGDGGAKPQDFVKKLEKQFSVPSLVSYNKSTLEYWDKVSISNQYGNDWTFGNAVSSIAKQTGDQTFPSNISKSGIVVMPPFSWQGGNPEQVVEATTSSPSPPNPAVRYGYFLGPSVINSVTRSAMWKPPQQSNDNTPGSQKFGSTGGNTQQNPPTAPQGAIQKTAKSTTSPLGTTGQRATPAVTSKKNPKGPERQNALNQEKGSEMSFSTFLCPVLVGLKPHDILYIPSLAGDYIEDWIVQSVGYSQQDGNIEVSVQATRVLGLGTPMNKKEGEKFLGIAKAKKLVGAGATLEAWDNYAWGATTTNTLQIASTSLSGAGALSTEKLTPGGVF